ncbi:hypothetical protein FACS1894178_3910 [Bacteroidia bacterium]|nr:hypothetical protein FACS1894178_3910 [Bacteroidia bacterium]
MKMKIPKIPKILFGGALIKGGVTLYGAIKSDYVKNPQKKQHKVLAKILTKAATTSFGKKYGFDEILVSEDIYGEFTKRVPVFDYNSMHDRWWYRAMLGEHDVTWAGKLQHFALSSGTSGSPSKYIPVTRDMIKHIQKTSIRQILSMSKYSLPADIFTKGMLMLGGSTHLQYNGTYYAGDLSGITTGNIPFWFQHYFKPGKAIAKESDWQVKLDEIVKNAPNWDIAAIVGVPAWHTILMERIIERYHLNTIHDIWPNLSIFCHGGVSISPYMKGFEKLFGKPMIYIETYLASEGFIAFQNRPNSKGMELVLNLGIFFEFIPFDDDNFHNDGSVKPNPIVLPLEKLEEGKEYALLLTSVAGAYRYLIGDTIKLTDKKYNEIVITGRTKSFLSICGEHLSVDNLNCAIARISKKRDIEIPEYCVVGETSGNMFAHRWYIACNENLSPQEIAMELDTYLGEINDDYRTERLEAIRNVFVEILPVNVFYEYMREQGKEGAQNKFPRVLRGDAAEKWIAYVKEHC